MIKNIFLETTDGKDVTDIIANYFALISISASVFITVVALWTILHS